ncbi:MAG: response regulator [Caldilineaceae bacterium]|nr:response regulator [Caldilineaceae bacterium]
MLTVTPVQPLVAPLSVETNEALTIAQQLCALCAGILTLPFSAPSAQELRIQLQLPLFKRIPLLAVDDNDDTRQLLQRYLANSPYHLISIADPHETLAVAEKYHPHLILLDVMLPDIDGWELLGRLRQHPITEQVPIIICTILPQQPLALALGATAFLRKPVTQQALLAMLDHQLGRCVPAAR